MHFTSAKGCIGGAEIGTYDDNFDHVDWLATIDVSYNPSTDQTTYKARDTTLTTIPNIQQTQRPQAYTTICMVPGDILSNRTGPNVEVGCKIDTCANAMPSCVFRRLCPAVFYSTGKSLEKCGLA